MTIMYASNYKNQTRLNQTIYAMKYKCKGLVKKHLQQTCVPLFSAHPDIIKSHVLCFDTTMLPLLNLDSSHMCKKEDYFDHDIPISHH